MLWVSSVVAELLPRRWTFTMRECSAPRVGLDERCYVITISERVVILVRA